MTNLRAIHASFNKIEHVSDSIKRFDKLQSLRLNDNCIAKMPNLTQVCLFIFVHFIYEPLWQNPSMKTFCSKSGYDSDRFLENSSIFGDGTSFQLIGFP